MSTTNSVLCFSPIKEWQNFKESYQAWGQILPKSIKENAKILLIANAGFLIIAAIFAYIGFPNPDVRLAVLGSFGIILLCDLAFCFIMQGFLVLRIVQAFCPFSFLTKADR